MRKVYVDVIARHTKDGNTEPISIIWEDGRTYEIDKVFECCRSASLKVGGQGIRYTCRIQGKQTYIYCEENKWFMEGK